MISNERSYVGFKDWYRLRLTGSCFTKFDEDLTRAFAIYCGVSIFHVSSFSATYTYSTDTSTFITYNYNTVTYTTYSTCYTIYDYLRHLQC